LSCLKTRHKRIAILIAFLAGATLALLPCVLKAFQSNLVFFYYRQSQIYQQRGARGSHLPCWGVWFRRGGVQRDGVRVNFVVTDTAQTVPVRYQGILPDLFKEGKGVVAQGQLVNGVFEAKEVLAKHDENYMPPEAAEALKNAAASNEKTSSSLVQGE